MSLNCLLPFLSAQCQCFVCMHCVVCCATASWLIVLSLSFDGPVISICLCYVCRCFSFLHSTLKSCYSVSFTYCMFDVCPPCAGLLCFACDIMAVFSVLSQYSLCHFSVAAVLCEGYLAAISGFIFALSFGLSQCCCPRVIICHDQGGDLSFWQHLILLLGVSWQVLLVFFWLSLIIVVISKLLDFNSLFCFLACWMSKYLIFKFVLLSCLLACVYAS